MTDTPSTILLTREQSTGSNTNLWGGYLITTQRQTEQASKGTQSLAVTGDATISWTNYTTGNTGQCAVLRLTGTLTAVATLTFPAYQNWMEVTNATGKTVTIKCSGGTGVAIPTGTQTAIFCDATDYYSASPTTLASYVATLTNAGDIVVKTTLEAAIAGASGLTAPFILVSASDTTPGYLGQKLTTQITGATTTQLSGLTSAQWATVNGGGNEQRALQVPSPYVGAYINDGVKTSQYTPVVGHSAIIDTSAASWTINLTGMTTPQIEQSFKLICIGGIDPYFLGTLNSTTNGTATVSGSTEFVYVGGTIGWAATVASTNMGANFTDANKFIPGVMDESGGLGLLLYGPNLGTGETAISSVATFWTILNQVGAIVQSTFDPNTAKTVLTVAATTKGEVAHIVGPRNYTAGAQTFVITRDGGTAQTIIISVVAAGRAFLSSGGLWAGTATGPATQSYATGTLDSAKRVFTHSAGASPMLPQFEFAKSQGTGMFEFSRSLTVTITSTSTIVSANHFNNSAGVMYRTIGS